MKRKIKFRFRDKRFKGFLTFSPHPIGLGVHYNGAIYNSNDFRNIDTSTIQEFTGLKDKNGKEIYEGDIVLDPISTVLDPISTINSIVTFHDGAFWIEFKTYQVWREVLKDRINNIEVIGNIFESPELI